MKYLVLILVVVAVLWLMRANRRPPPPKHGKPKLPPVEDMVACAECGLHLPRGEALPGRGGFFCSDTHRAAHEKLNAPR
jgi:uncharacterized protein